MAKISSKETKPEILVRKFLFSQGLRFKKNCDKLPGKPDIVLPKYKTTILIHGCFWHSHSCKASKLPETRMEFWRAKINANKKRDSLVRKALQKLGWNVIVVWQCEIRSKKHYGNRLPLLYKQILLNI